MPLSAWLKIAASESSRMFLAGVADELIMGHTDLPSRWGRLIFHVTDVDTFWTHLKERGFSPEIPQNASWGERYFHMLDPDGHELSFARPLQ
jgi:uncharacterized glyoxalase superfamily protein PhnB